MGFQIKVYWKEGRTKLAETQFRRGDFQRHHFYIIFSDKKKVLKKMERKCQGEKTPVAFLIILLLTLFSSILVKAEKEDLSVLISFKKSSISSDPNGILSNWSPNSSSPCSFAGVTCSDAGDITSVDLSGESLSGKLHLGKITTLPFLTHLNLAGNFFSGDLSGESPPQCRLERLDISSNNFSLPLSLNLSCTNFLSLNLSNNQIPGGTLNLPPSLSLLDLSGNRIADPSLFSPLLSKTQNLNFLNLSHNKMSGNLSFLSNLPKTLKTLDLSHNNFTQNLSNLQFNSCKNLSVLNLSHNAMYSSVSPAFLMSCPLLEVLDLGYNQLEFKIPENLLDNLKNLRKLNFEQNRLFGEIPMELGYNCGKIEELDLSGNSLIGGLPWSFTNCSSIISLNLGKNQLIGDFLGIISSLTSLKYLYLAFNNLTGDIPFSLSNNSKIVELNLSSNGFTGKIPSGFCSSSSSPVLEKLSLASNYFSGTIPSELGKCKNLRQIDFSFNDLSGEIPIEIWNLPKISHIAMWANSLTGEIPEGICINTGKNLQTLILNNNLMTGNLPHAISNCTDLLWVSLSNNRLTGTIPPGIGNLINLAILQLGNNSFSGQIPKELGNCRSLIWLDLNSNGFSGEIPIEISENTGFIKRGAVSGIKFVFIRNEGGTTCRGTGGLVEFEGIRMKRFENFPMVHSCPSIRIYTGWTVYAFFTNGSMVYLDLSYNALSGTIPENIGSMAYLQVLNLGHNNLTGSIPSGFGGLKAVGVLDLSHNNLQGIIPGSLGGLSFLNDLDVSNNNLTGNIPSGGQLTTFLPSRYENNTGLCGVPLPPCPPKNRPKNLDRDHGRGKNGALIAEKVIGIGACVLCVFALILAFYRTRYRQNKERKEGKYIESLPTSGNSSWKLSGVAEPLSINVATFENPLRKLTFAHLLKATNGFSSESLIGSGGFGEVYKAQLKDGSIVAIKKLKHATSQGDREFVAEMQTIGKIRHRNLVPLLGYCKVGEERLLVYDYMKWGSLESVLHENKESKLNWISRKRIAIGSAKGLAFLHHSCIPHIIHRDMKSSNVLLDENFDARVSDFGMARLVSALDSHLSVSTLAGTPGYVPPEYYQSFRCTTKGDVYSYGVILLELLSGKRPIDPLEFGEDNNLVGWAKQLYKEKKVHEILDPELVSKESSGAELYQCLKIAFECIEDKPFRRPTMIQVMSMFRDLQTDSEHDVHDDVALKNTVIEERQEKEM